MDDRLIANLVLASRMPARAMQVTADELEMYNLTGLHNAARKGDLAGVQELSTHKNVGVAGLYGKAVLHVACSEGYAHIVEWLIKFGANVNMIARNGQTPLACAAEWSNTLCVKLLLEAGANPSIPDNFGNIPLHFERKSTESSALFIAAYPSGVNVANMFGNTPLHYAAEHDATHICTLLLSAGSNANAVNKRGYTPLYLAFIWNCIATSKCLIEGGAQLKLIKLDNDLKTIPDWVAPFVARRNACAKKSRIITSLRKPGVDPHLFKMLGKYVWATQRK